MTTDTSERGLGRLICTALTGALCYQGVAANMAQQRPATYAAGWICGAAEDYDREECLMAARQIGGAALASRDNWLIDMHFCDVLLFDGCLIAAGPHPEGWT